ncbi:hypothetical protein ONZ51_g9688 [Trametes cubensis]|uniref:Uncharacterized protein n=1 Tax=Trametes cubensis TaxID=1111947 RepID=A0AAD7X737_9APHY|nr:hypothetical protein ONZ51_g9688 [Trametes cubensis]
MLASWDPAHPLYLPASNSSSRLLLRLFFFHSNPSTANQPSNHNLSGMLDDADRLRIPSLRRPRPPKISRLRAFLEPRSSEFKSSNTKTNANTNMSAATGS